MEKELKKNNLTKLTDEIEIIEKKFEDEKNSLIQENKDLIIDEIYRYYENINHKPVVIKEILCFKKEDSFERYYIKFIDSNGSKYSEFISFDYYNDREYFLKLIKEKISEKIERKKSLVRSYNHLIDRTNKEINDLETNYYE